MSYRDARGRFENNKVVMYEAKIVKHSSLTDRHELDISGSVVQLSYAIITHKSSLLRHMKCHVKGGGGNVQV